MQYLNNIVEQDHRFVKKRTAAKQGFRGFGSARRTVDGYEAIHRMRKGQVRWLPARDIVRHNRYIVCQKFAAISRQTYVFRHDGRSQFT